MPDEITIKPKPESTIPTESTPTNSTANVSRSQLISLCAAGLGASFFLPWAHFFGATPSGFDIQKMGDQQRFLWLIPICSAFTVFASVHKRTQQIAAELTGILPFIAFAYWYHQIGHDLMNMLAYGSVLSLAFGFALMILGHKGK